MDVGIDHEINYKFKLYKQNPIKIQANFLKYNIENIHRILYANNKII